MSDDIVRVLEAYRVGLLRVDGDRDLGFQSNITTDASMAIADALKTSIDTIEALRGEVATLTKDREILTLDLIDRAKEIDALRGEVERLTVAAKAADMFHAINGHGIKQAEELADHIIRQMLWGMRIDDSNKGIVRGYLLDHFKAVISRAEKAEAEAARMKEIVSHLANHDDPHVRNSVLNLLEDMNAAKETT